MPQALAVTGADSAQSRRTRFTLELPNGVDRKLDRLVSATGCSKTDIIREAVKLYYEMAELARKDYEVGATKIDADGTKIVVRIPLDVLNDLTPA